MLLTVPVAAVLRLTLDPGTARTMAGFALVVLPLERLLYGINAASNNALRHRRWLRVHNLVEGGVELEGLVLEPATWSDRHAILDLLLDSESLRANGWGMDEIEVCEHWHRSRLLFRLYHRYSLVARFGPGEPAVAWIGLQATDDLRRPGLHLSLGVHPEHRGQGIGGKVLRAALEVLWVDRPVWLGTSVGNVPVRRIMARLGYRQLAPERHTLPDGSVVDGLWYRLRVGKLHSLGAQRETPRPRPMPRRHRAARDVGEQVAE